MKFHPRVYNRRSIRLLGYDYSLSGAYFVTICTQNRDCLFGDIVDLETVLNDAGRMVETVWLELPARFPDMELDEFVVMPNHFHGIVVLRGRDHPTDRTGEYKIRPYGKLAGTLGRKIQAFKSMTTHE